MPGGMVMININKIPMYLLKYIIIAAHRLVVWGSVGR